MVIRWVDLVLYIVCVATVIIAGYDLLHLKQIENEVLDRCNAHWQAEVERVCKSSSYTPGFPVMPNYSLNIEIDIGQ